MKRLAFALATVAAALLSGCGKQGSPADPPVDMRVEAGDASVIVTWTAEPDVDYWIFYAPGPNVTTTNWASIGGTALPRSTSPRIITGLANDREYSFTMNARRDGGAGGPGAPTQVVTPRLAGENWRVNAPIGTTRLNGIAGGTILGGFAVVTVGAGGTIYAGVQNSTPTAQTNPLPGIDLNGVCSGLYGFLAVGANGTTLTSLDIFNWTQQTSGTTATLNSCASSITGVYVAVGAGGTVALSTNGNTTWTTPSLNVTTDLYAVANGNLRFVAVGAGGTIITSSDGGGWTQATSNTTNDLRGVTHGLVASADGTTSTSLYVAVGANGTVVTSPDAATWTVVPAFTNRTLRSVTYGGRFVAVGEGGVIFTSLDGVNWETRSSGTTADLNAVVRQLSGYTAVGDAGTNVSTF